MSSGMLTGSAKRPPKVSVVIPTYNRAHLIGQAIRSVLRQTFTDYEIIVVDDGSSDNTRDVVNGFRDDRIRYIRHTENRGAGAARNTGIKTANAKYIAFQDSDDEWLPGKLEEQVPLLESADSGIGAVYTAMWRIMKHGASLFPDWVSRKNEGDISDAILEGCFVGIPTVLIRKSCFDRVGLLDEKLYYADDWELFIRLAQHYRFSLVKEVLVISRQQPDSLTTERFNPIRIKAMEAVFAKHHGRFSKNRIAAANIHRTIGGLYCRIGDIRKGRRHLVRSLKSNPINIKCMIMTAASLFGHDAYLGVLGLKHRLMSGRLRIPPIRRLVT